MPTANDVAKWMLDRLDNTPWLYQEDTVYKIRAEFGDDFVYSNESGNLAISKAVLREFRKISEGKVVWEKGEKAWRKVRAGEKYKGRQVE